MKRRLLAIFLSLTLMLSLVPSAWAVENEESSQEAVVEEPETELDEGLQARINALPDAATLAEMDEDALNEVYDEVQAIYEALDALSAEETDALELTPLETAVAFFTKQVAPLDVPDGNVISEDTAWNTATTLTENLIVGSGVTLTIGAPVTISGDVTISGGTIKRGEGYEDNMVVIPADSSLTLQSVIIDGGATWESGSGEISGISASEAAIKVNGSLTLDSGAVVQNNQRIVPDNAEAWFSYNDGSRYYVVGGGISVIGGSLTMNTGSEVKNNVITASNKINDKTSDAVGAGIGFYDSKAFVMNGGTVSENKALSTGTARGIGGGIGAVSHPGNIFSATLAGGTITGNFGATSVGGAYFTSDNEAKNDPVSVTISGVTIKDNTTPGSGAGMSIYGGQLTMTAGTISGNKATGDSRNGGGINLSYSTGTISDGTISNNSAGANGGGISVSHCELTISGGAVSQNTAKMGGGITSASSEDVITLSGGTISNNIATNGAGVRMAGGTLYVSGKTTISKNNSAATDDVKNAASGGGIYVANGTKLFISGGEISENVAKNGAGVYYLDAANKLGTLELSGGQISKNSAVNGGGFYLSSAGQENVTISGGVISSNTASGKGGGIYHNGKGGFSVTEAAQISKNTSANGGGIFIEQGTLAMTDGTISENAAQYCGGIYIAANSDKVHTELSLTGGEITKNKSANNGGGIMDRGILSVSGTPIVTENTKGGTYDADKVAFIDSENPEANNVYLLSGKQITLSGALTSGATIGVTTQTAPTDKQPVQITATETGTSYYEDAARYFIPDKAKVIAQANSTDGYVELAQTTESYYKVTLKLENASATGGMTTMVKASEDYNAAITADTGYTLPIAKPDNLTTYDLGVGNRTASIVIKGVSSDTTITIKAVPNTYTVEFVGNGSTGGTMSTQTMTYDASVQLSANQYTKTGYNFVGWSTTANGSCEYPDGASVKNMTTENGATVKLYAVWSAKKSLSAFDSGDNAIQSYKYDGSAKQYTLTSELEGFTITYKQGEDEVAEPTNVGTYDVIISRDEDATYAAFSQTITGGLVITPADYPVTIEANKTSMTGSGTVKLTVSSSVAGLTVTGITCSDPSITVTANSGGTYFVTLPNVTKTYTFTAVVEGDLSNYGEGPATCTVSVTRRHTSSVTPGNSISVPSTPNGTVTVNPSTATKGETVTITTKPSEGYELGSIEVLDKNGDSLKLKDLGNGKYSFVMPDGKVSVEAEFVKTASASFADVPANAYFADAVEWAVNKGVTNGLSDTMFGPYESCTRAQIVTFLWRAAGSPEPKAVSSFSDVPASAYYAKAVAWAVENGITNGMTETAFAPNATCTRGQSVTFLYRALKGTASGSANFTDVASDAFYADAVNWAVASDVTNGTSNTTFSPNADCTRAEIVTFLYRAYQGK